MADQRRCRSCRSTKPAGEFYAGCSECKDCKRDRSRANRALQARKIAVAERLVEALFLLAGKAAQPDAERQTEAAA